MKKKDWKVRARKRARGEKETRRWGAWQSPPFPQYWFCVELEKQPDPVGLKKPCTGTANIPMCLSRFDLGTETAMHLIFKKPIILQLKNILYSILQELYHRFTCNNTMQLLNIIENWAVLHSTQKPRKVLRFSIEMTSSWVIFPIVYPKGGWLFILHFFIKSEAVWPCVVCIHITSHHFSLNSGFTFKSQMRRVYLSFRSNRDNTDQIKALFQRDTETRRCISETRLCTSSECAAEWHHGALPVPSMVRTTKQHHDLEGTLVF